MCIRDRYMGEVIDNEVLSKDFMKAYYKGTLRVFLILLHDFNEFLSDFSFGLCEEIPDKFIQIRNMVLSAFPSSMRPPDPYTIDINLTDINEFKNMPNIISNSEERLMAKNIYSHLMGYIATKSEAEFRALCHKFETTGPDNEPTIDVPIVNAFILALPIIVFREFVSATQEVNLTKINELRLETYRLLVKILLPSNYEMREFILNAIVNQIRYPNVCLLYTSPSPRDRQKSRMPSSA
eukprot:TRINITY_DN8797_c0_g1_i2.p1 TRINITY_DN8797_c0_g1~~TRINITY_DN8797_c0_g1_i2.p1  ORF type:complete len:238 (-),score=65.09 TRINITY_DN8797_c0_g1_i2:22-735(-)